MFYKCKYFDIKELVPKKVYEQRGEKAWELLDSRALMMLDKLREKFGRCIVNTKIIYNESGLRNPDCEHYSQYSQHTFGRAFDCKFVDYTAEEIRNYIYNNLNEFEYITFIEDGVDWLHFDVRNKKDLTVWNFKTKKSFIIKRG